MKLVITILTMVAANLGMADTVKIGKKTEVLKIELEMSFSHNCPSDLQLVARYDSKDVYNVELDGQIQSRVDYLKSAIQSSCAEEITEIERQELAGPVCLSYGRSQGTVYIPINRWSRPDELTINAPSMLRIKKITQLAPVQNETIIDCEVEPSIMCCMAETSSCTQCRQNAASKLRDWQEACLED